MKSLRSWCLLSIGLLIGLSGFGLFLGWINDAHGRGFIAWPEAALLSVLTLAYVGGAVAFLRHRRNRFF